MNLNHLNYFRTLAHLEHYTKAAKELSITQPSLSHAISLLEKDLGVALFEKQGRNIRLTKHGRFFLTYVEHALSEIEMGERRLHELSEEPQGLIKIGLSPMIPSDFLRTKLNNFTLSHPTIQTTFTQATTPELLTRLKKEDDDLFFCLSPVEDEEIEFIPIKLLDFTVITSLTHPLTKKETLELEELLHYPFIFFNHDTELRSMIDTLFEPLSQKPTINAEVLDSQTMLTLVSLNHGIGIVPKGTLTSEIVKSMPLSNVQNVIYIYLAMRKNSYLSPALSLFKDYLVKK